MSILYYPKNKANIPILIFMLHLMESLKFFTRYNAGTMNKRGKLYSNLLLSSIFVFTSYYC